MPLYGNISVGPAEMGSHGHREPEGLLARPSMIWTELTFHSLDYFNSFLLDPGM